MRVLVTGGTGFVGSHIVKALVESGHDVKLFVRDPDRIEPAMRPHGIGELDHAVGDVVDAAAVADAMEGCDAVLHAASIYSLDVRKSNIVRHVNVTGTDIVLGTAHKLRLDPIVYVSTVLALLPPENGEVLTPDTAIKHPPGAYLESKADGERIARRFQAEGAPIVITYPSAVFGPDDPHFGESAQIAKDILTGKTRVAPKGGLSIVDVRDVAQAIAATFEPKRGPRRYFLSGMNISYHGLIDAFGNVTGRKLRYVVLPPSLLRPFVLLAGMLQRILPFRLPVNVEGFHVVEWNPKGDDSGSTQALNFHPRDIDETLYDVIRWMHQGGHISVKQAGQIAES